MLLELCPEDREDSIVKVMIRTIDSQATEHQRVLSAGCSLLTSDVVEAVMILWTIPS